MKTESIKSTTYPLSGIAYGMADNISLYICPNKTKALLVHYRKGSENIMVGIYVPLSMTDVPLTFCSESRIIDRELTAVKTIFLFIFFFPVVFYFPACTLTLDWLLSAEHLKSNGNKTLLHNVASHLL